MRCNEYDRAGDGERIVQAQLPGEGVVTSLESYGTGSSDPGKFLAMVNRQYPDFAALIEAKTLEETKGLVAGLRV